MILNRIKSLKKCFLCDDVTKRRWRLPSSYFYLFCCSYKQKSLSCTILCGAFLVIDQFFKNAVPNKVTPPTKASTPAVMGPAARVGSARE